MAMKVCFEKVALLVVILMIQFFAEVAYSQTSTEVYTYHPVIHYQKTTCQTDVQTDAGKAVPNTIEFNCYSKSGDQCTFKYNSILGKSDLTIQTYKQTKTKEGHSLLVQTNYDVKTTPNASIYPINLRMLTINPTVSDKNSMDFIGTVAQKWMEDLCDAKITAKPVSIDTYEESPFPVGESKACTLQTQTENGKLTQWSVDCVNLNHQPYLQCTVQAEGAPNMTPYYKASFSKTSYTTSGKSEVQTSDESQPNEPVLNFDQFKNAAIKYLKAHCPDVLFPEHHSASGNQIENKTDIAR